MGKHFDELAKALASGVSRRAALKRFATGVAGAAVASVFSGRSASADLSPSVCQQICREIVGPKEGREFGKCVSSCAKCVGQGGFPRFFNNGELICISINSVNGT